MPNASRSYLQNKAHRWWSPLRETSLQSGLDSRQSTVGSQQLAVASRQSLASDCQQFTVNSVSVISHRVSKKAQQFTESVIREMTRLALEHGAVNLAQGFPDFPAPAEVKEPRSSLFGEIPVSLARLLASKRLERHPWAER